MFITEKIYICCCVKNKGLCVSRPPDLCLTPGPGPQFVFTGPGPKFLFTGPAQSETWASINQSCPPSLYSLALAYDLYYRALNLHLLFYL